MIWKFLIIAIWTCLPSVAFGQTTCAPRPMLATALYNVGGLVPVVDGLSTHGTLIELFLSPTRSWAIVETQPNGLACTVTMGHGLDTMGPKVIPEGKPG
jgi:hypothetical protein